MKEIRILSSQIVYLEGFGSLVIKESEDGNWLINLTPSFYSNDLSRINIGINHYFELGTNLEKHYKSHV